MLLDTAGTASVLAGCTARFAPDEQNRALLVMRSVIPGLWHPLAYIAGGGQALRWFRDSFFHTEDQDREAYDLLADQAARIPPGAEGLIFSPHLGGRVCPSEPAMRGAWVGFSWGHTQAHFFRSILEGIAFEYAYYLRILGELIPDLSLVEARVIGGGAKSAVWNQIKADILGVPYQRLKRSEFATWGSAMIAGRAVGLLSDLAETATAAAEADGRPAVPRPEVTEVYRRLADRYVGWQRTLSDAFHSFADSGSSGDTA
jgi:xylulokinase